MLVYDTPDIQLYNNDCCSQLRQIPPYSIDMIFADPPYFLSNNTTIWRGFNKNLDKGDWDKSKGFSEDYKFTIDWMHLCQSCLKPNGTMWISGTQHNIYMVGYIAQILDMKILNNIVWEKPNPPPNFACRRFTQSTETILWLAKTPKSKYTFNYKDMRIENGMKQMKDVWRFRPPNKAEKSFGKHPTQKPVALLERIIKSSTNPNDLVLDPFNGSGTTGVACKKLNRKYIGIELDKAYCDLSIQRFT